jgi:apoptosis-inducing factor 1
MLFPEQVTSFRDVEDFKKLEKLTKNGKIKEICIIGGSLLGTELSFALSSHTKARITQVYLEPEVLSRIFPRYLSKHIGNELRQSGVLLKPNSNVLKVTKNTSNSKLNLHLDSGEIVESDYIITAMGIYPNTELAEEAGLEIDHKNGGIVSNAELESRSNVFVAGDILSYHDVFYGKRRRSEHYLHAMSTGTRAGLNMTGNTKPYKDLTLIWSESGKNSWEAIGEIDSRLDTYSVWNGAGVRQNGSLWNVAPSTPMINSLDKGVVYYLNEQKQVVGILLWNVPNKFKNAKQVLVEKKNYDDLSELNNKILLD